MLKATRLAVPLLLTLSLLTGCSGLTVNLTAVPDPANPGDSVKWTVSVRNDTACQTTDEDFDPPDSLPSGAPVLALFIGFNPQLGAFGPAEFCRQFQMGTICDNLSCLPPILTDALGPAAAERIMAEMHNRASSEAQPLTIGTCQTLVNDSSSGFVGLCGFDPLNPGQTHTAMHTDDAPDTGNRDSAQLAVAFALASGPDCRPGTEISPGLWIVGGCFPTPETSQVPTLSPLTLALLGSLLLAAGAVTLHFRRSS